MTHATRSMPRRTRRGPISTRCSRGLCSRAAPGCARCSPPMCRPRRCSRPRRPTRARGRRRSLARRGNRCAPPARVIGSGGRRRGVPGAVRRCRKERGEPLRLALSRAAVGATPGRDSRRHSPASGSRASGEQRVRGPLSVVLETMRMLVAGDADRPPAPHRRTARFLRAVPDPLGASIAAPQYRSAPLANYYRQVASFTDGFLAIERDSFAIE